MTPDVVQWPEVDGPRVLTLVGNDVTIDTRARKTAAGLARRGFSVIALGVDAAGSAPAVESLGAATIVRARPSHDGRLSPALVPLSRAEWRDRARHRHEVERDRLVLAQRHLEFRLHDIRRTADASPARAGRPRWWSLLVIQLRVRTRRVPVIVLHRRLQVLGLVSRVLSRSLAWPTPVRWRRDLPELHRNHDAVAAAVDRLQPDLIHVHDVFHLFTAVAAKRRAAREGRSVVVVYDAHEYVPGLPVEARRREAYTQLEIETVPEVDGIVTVSPGLIEHFERRFGRTPGLVANAPEIDESAAVDDVRRAAGLGPQDVLLVYVGGVAPHRGGDLLIDALTLLPADHHIVLVVNSSTGYVADLVERARREGVGHRFHCVPYVAPERVVGYMRSADASLIPLSRDVENYEVALPNKLFQSIQAGVPVVTSDNPDLVRFVAEHGIGTVFRGGDAAALAAAAVSAIEENERFRSALADPALRASTTWEAQLDVLIGVYRSCGVGR